MATHSWQVLEIKKIKAVRIIDLIDLIKLQFTTDIYIRNNRNIRDFINSFDYKLLVVEFQDQYDYLAICQNFVHDQYTKIVSFLI